MSYEKLQLLTPKDRTEEWSREVTLHWDVVDGRGVVCVRAESNFPTKFSLHHLTLYSRQSGPNLTTPTMNVLFFFFSFLGAKVSYGEEWSID